ncbi:hypothetical protein HDU97_001331 [Phlyctochytrium planicorne]|nr:hypothetical protein HDU97_001331 [Phlyctochytrium planicorne]
MKRESTAAYSPEPSSTSRKAEVSSGVDRPIRRGASLHRGDSTATTQSRKPRATLQVVPDMEEQFDVHVSQTFSFNEVVYETVGGSFMSIVSTPNLAPNSSTQAFVPLHPSISYGFIRCGLISAEISSIFVATIIVILFVSTQPSSLWSYYYGAVDASFFKQMFTSLVEK